MRSQTGSRAETRELYVESVVGMREAQELEKFGIWEEVRRS